VTKLILKSKQKKQLLKKKVPEKKLKEPDKRSLIDQKSVMASSFDKLERLVQEKIDSLSKNFKPVLTVYHKGGDMALVEREILSYKGRHKKHKNDIVNVKMIHVCSEATLIVLKVAD
jgi:transcription termination factor NusB